VELNLIENMTKKGSKYLTIKKINKVKNAEFICGDVEFAFDELINKKKIIPTAIIVDPPRKGLDTKTIQNILKIKPENYVLFLQIKVQL
jgi:tRNA/tmRNA/rRNA uracil-C5-methylase (TrmA/RlmC/RlmD family)